MCIPFSSRSSLIAGVICPLKLSIITNAGDTIVVDVIDIPHME